MFEDLDWRGATKRAAVAAVLYILFVYLMGVAFPDSFGTGTNVVSTLAIALIFFLVYAPVFAFAERRKRRRVAELRTQKKGKKPGTKAAKPMSRSSTEDREDSEGGLKGRHNPNTSRKKAARRQRRR